MCGSWVQKLSFKVMVRCRNRLARPKSWRVVPAVVVQVGHAHGDKRARLGDAVVHYILELS